MTEQINMTASQAKALCNILHGLTDAFDYSRSGKYEIKEYKVNDCHYFISVIIEVGMIEDEGTLASLICRDRVHLFIGKRGGITYPCRKTDTTKRFTGSLLRVSLDQNIRVFD